MPAAVAPEGFQTHQAFVSFEGPELAGAFEAALILAAGRFNGPGTQGFVGQFGLLDGGAASLTGLPCGDDFLVFHPRSVVLEVFDFGLEFFLFGLE